MLAARLVDEGHTVALRDLAHAAPDGHHVLPLLPPPKAHGEQSARRAPPRGTVEHAGSTSPVAPSESCSAASVPPSDPC